MSVELRQYQWGSIHGIQQFFKKMIRRIVLILPPGAGKTVIAGYMLTTAIARGNRCLFIADREELIAQARDKFSSQFGLDAGMIKSGYAPDPSKLLQIASIQTLTRRVRPPAKLVIADECHVTVAPNFKKILQLYYDEGAYIVGLTGTPRLTNKRRGLNEFYDDFVANIPKSQLLAQGALVPMKCYVAANIIEKKFSMKDGDFNQQEVMQAFDKADVYKNLLEAYKLIIGKKKCIVFCCNVEHSIKTRDALRSIGVRAEHVDGTTSDDERARIISAYRMGLIDCLTNYDILTKGFDVPNTMAVVFNCATASEIRYIQGAGRAERPDVASGKTHGIFLDMADNVFRFGLPDEDREPSIQPRINADKEKGVAPMKRCVNCGLIIRASATVCPECATEQPIKTKKKTIKEVQFELIEKEDFDVKPYLHLKQKEWYKIPSNLLKAFARRQNPPYNHGWVTRQLALRGESRKMIEILDYSGADYHKQKNILEKAYAGYGNIDAHTWEFVQEKGDLVKQADGTDKMVMHTAVFRYKLNEDITPEL